MSLREQDICNIIVGTAGHIDHGKTSLVRALTGIDPDRLKEEQERGMTIDLGFASLQMPDGRRVGFLDVPGHERFVKNMVAGCTSVDFAILVIAADDGPMPQTREHLDILKLLGIQRGLIALTKIDIVDPDLVELQKEDIRDLVKGTFLEGTGIHPISTQTGQGMDAFKAALFQEIAKTPPRIGHGPFRVPIQRVFSVKGQGAVLTGIPISGSVHAGDTIIVLPQGLTGKVRHIQAYFQDAESARTGHSSAVNVSDIDYKKVSRGDVMAAPGYFQPCTRFDAQFHYLRGNKKPLKDRAQIRFHCGTAELLGTIVMIDRASLQPGEECGLQIVLDLPYVVAPGDRYILRLPSPAVTIGGGRALWANAPKLKKNSQAATERFQRLAEVVDSLDARVQFALEESGFAPMSVDAVVLATSLLKPDAQTALERLREKKKALPVQQGASWWSSLYFNRAIEKIHGEVKKQLDKNPALPGVELREIQSKTGWSGPTLNVVLQALEEKKQITISNNLLALPNRQIKFGPEEQRAVDYVLAELQASPFSPPAQRDMEEGFGNKFMLARMIKTLLQQGRIVRVSDEFLLTREVVADAVRRVQEFLADGQGRTSADIKSVFNTSRKYLIPLLEYLDSAGVTVRRGDLRFLREAPATPAKERT